MGVDGICSLDRSMEIDWTCLTRGLENKEGVVGWKSLEGWMGLGQWYGGQVRGSFAGSQQFVDKGMIQWVIP